jgi:hypothetical protein
MAGLDPAIHVFLLSAPLNIKTWMAGTSPGMTTLEIVIARSQRVRPFGRPDDKLSDEAIQLPSF